MMATPVADIVTANELFCKNMAALWRTDPELAVLIDAVPDEARLPVEPTRSGDWTVAAVTPQGQRVYLHSRYDPVAEAKKFADTVEMEGAGQVNEVRLISELDAAHNGVAF